MVRKETLNMHPRLKSKKQRGTIFPKNKHAFIRLVWLDIALLQTLIDPHGDIGRNHGAEFINILALESEIAAQSRINNSRIKAKKRLSGLLNARVLVRETSDEESIGAVWVEFRMQSAAGEDGHLVGGEGVFDSAGAVLECELRH